MFIRVIETPGLASLSYLIGDEGHAVVIDPRRDVEVYLEMARDEAVTIDHILETHRNEDFVIGSCDLAERTGATVLRGNGTELAYGEPAHEGDVIECGQVRLKVLATPGHTPESLSFVLQHQETGTDALAVFCGDALLVGDVGRTDFHPGHEAEDAAHLYDSLHDMLLPLGDGCVVYPAHGAGSVCGDEMANRNFSTIGYERANNPMLLLDREAFIEAKVAEHHEKPPYFERMEWLNRKGPRPLGHRPQLRPLSPLELAMRMEDGAPLVDLREPQAFAGSHVPGSINLPLNLLSAYAGWFLGYDQDVMLLADDRDDLETARTRLLRLGFERTADYLKGGITGWETAGRPLETIPQMSVHDLRRRLREVTVLDVRKLVEWKAGHLPDAVNVFLGDLPQVVDDLDTKRPIVTFCGSGRRAMIAASILRRAGVERVYNCVGSMQAWKVIGGPLDET